MLKNIKQTDTRLLKVIQKYGCYFLCFAYCSPLIFDGESGCNQLNGIWEKATEKGYISGDLNHDGDFDDVREAEIQNPEAISREFFKLAVTYDNTHHEPDESIPSDVTYIFGMYFWKGSHFVVLNKNKRVIFDSLGWSNTVKYGTLKNMRWFYAD